MQVVIAEIFVDHTTLTTSADCKLIDAVNTKNFKNALLNRPTGDLPHQLGLDTGSFTNAGSESARITTFNVSSTKPLWLQLLNSGGCLQRDQTCRHDPHLGDRNKLHN